MASVDEPSLESGGVDPGHDSAAGADLPDRIRRLMNGEPYAVLCTQGGGQPYASIVAFACTDDLNTVVFATPIATRKYRLLVGCDRVALLVDNRASHPDDMMEVEAITATGRARRLDPGPEHDGLARILIERHPHLRGFILSASCALFRVSIVRYFHVVRFQEVHQWIPTHVS